MMIVTKTLMKSSMAFMAAALSVSLATDVCVAADTSLVKYRLLEQRTAHFDDATTAQTHVATVTKLGGTAKQGSHGGHYDVSYTCPTWKGIALKSHDEAHQWAHWLKANAFEAVFVEPAQAGHLETVAFRLPAGKSAHFDRATDAASQTDTLKMLGCEVKQGSHSGHYDVSYRCAKWRTIGLEGHDDAHKWEKWLTANGFETRHEHTQPTTASNASRTQ